MIRGLAACVAACAKALCDLHPRGAQGDEGSPSGRLSPPSATRHRCRRATEGAERDFAGNWRVGMCTLVGEEFSLADATADDKKMTTDLDEAGPLTRAAFVAQAYGVTSSGAPGFESMPTYQGNAHVFSRTLCMIHPVRCTHDAARVALAHLEPERAGVARREHTLGRRLRGSRDGKTSALVGSSVWVSGGLEIVEQIRENMEVPGVTLSARHHHEGGARRSRQPARDVGGTWETGRAVPRSDT